MIQIQHPQGVVKVEETGRDGYLVRVVPSDSGSYSQSLSRSTRYPPALIELITRNKTPLWLCDEIEREEDPGSVRSKLDRVIRACKVADRIVAARILDMGCGCGASTMNLARLASRGEVVGIDLDGDYLAVAKARADFYGYPNVRFERSPDGANLPENIGLFDFIVMNAVFEHLLPGERRPLLHLLWSRLRDGGLLLLGETPYRYAMFEVHTTGLPFINYLPSWFVHFLAPRLSVRIAPGTPWTRMLRDGIRGGSPREILGLLGGVSGKAELVEPDPAINPSWLEAWPTNLAQLSRCFRCHLPRSFRFMGKGLDGLIYWLHLRWKVPLAAELILGVRKVS